MNTLTYVFILTWCLATVGHVWLAQRQIGYVRQHRKSVPEAFLADIHLVAHQKAADYTVARTRFSLLAVVLNLIMALFWTLGGGLAWLDRSWHQVNFGPLDTGVLVIGSYALIMALLELPLSVYSTFGIEARFGFNRTPARTYALDVLKILLLAVILGVPLLYAVLWLMGRAGPLWWLDVWALWIGFSLALTWAYPVLIAPCFNRFSPLGDPNLKQRIEALLHRCGFASRGVYVMDGSARSAHGNAYFTGFGRNKRIVFFDTLMEKLAPDEIEGVLAHELGHFHLRHVIQRLALTALLSLAGLAILGWLARSNWFYRGLGLPHAASYLALLLFTLLVPPFLFLLEPLSSAWSRKHEFEADAYASQQADGNALIQALVKLYRDNASTLTPDPLYSAFHDSHPPALLRIARLRQLPGTARRSP